MYGKRLSHHLLRLQMSYKHLSFEERHYIEVELKKGESAQDIADSLGRSKTTITREIKRNMGQRGYRHKQAQNKTAARHQEKPKSIKLTEDIRQIIIGYIKADWSPEQVAGRLHKDGIVKLHHETIYQLILTDKANGGGLYLHLRHQAKRYRKRYGSAHNRTGIPNRTDIDERPDEANNRSRIGDWEADTIIGKNHKGAIVTLDDRKSKLRLAAPLLGKTAQGVKDAMEKLFSPLKKFVKTITFDNGKEFSMHEKIAKTIDCDTYFAKPYHSWERGQNENANGLLRQYFPKAMELIGITGQQVFEAIDKLNSRPRKCLGYKTPYEVFFELTGMKIRSIVAGALMT